MTDKASNPQPLQVVVITGMAGSGKSVALHALAGKSLAEQWPLRGNTPSDVADALPRTLATYADAVAAAQPAPHSQSRDFKDDILPWPR